MTLRGKLVFLFALTVAAATGGFAWSVTRSLQREFASSNRQRSDALVEQFQHELRQAGDEATNRVQGIADAESTLRMALDLNRPQADASLYANDARGLATLHQLDFLELFTDDGTLISSVQSPDQIGGKSDWLTSQSDWNRQGAFLRRVERPDGVELGLEAVRAVRVGEKNLYIVGGQRVDREFLRGLALPPGMRALLYRNVEASFVSSALASADGPVADADRFAPLIDATRKQAGPVQQTIAWTADAASAETFATLPLTGRNGELLGVLLLGSAQRDWMALATQVRILALAIAGAGLLLALLVGWWISASVTRPLDRLAAGAQRGVAGLQAASPGVPSTGEVGRLARALREMAARVTEERGKLQQAERVASWREVSRRLVHELKEPLFSLQVTVENLRRAREQTAERFDELFFESTTVLRAEIEVLKTIVARFADFAKMPPPRLHAVNVNEAIRATLKAFEPQFSAIGRPPVTPELYLDERAGRIQADPELLRAALDALVLRAIETMPTGGTLTVRTLRKPGVVRVELSDTGMGLAPEECARTFTSYYTNRQGGLGLATVQSIVNDLGGSMFVESAPGAGTTYRLDFALAPATAAPELPSLPPAPPTVRRKLPAAPAEVASVTPSAVESYENAVRSEE